MQNNTLINNLKTYFQKKEFSSATREEVAKILNEYLELNSLKNLKDHFDKLVTEYNLDENNPFIKSIYYSIKNRQIAQEYVAITSNFRASILLSGSNSWGSFFAVTEQSDIDLLIVAEQPSYFDKIIDRAIADKMLNPIQKKRFLKFLELLNENRANHFSLRDKYKDTWISIDFLCTDVIQKIVDLSPMQIRILTDDQSNLELRTINEFRSNPPKPKGYTVDYLSSNHKTIYHPDFQPIKDQENNVIGYLAETLVDAKTKTENPNYLLGVISFFLLACPTILEDSEHWLIPAINKFKRNIRKMIQNQPINNVTRLDRMPNLSFKTFIQSIIQNK